MKTESAILKTVLTGLLAPELAGNFTVSEPFRKPTRSDQSHFHHLMEIILLFERGADGGPDYGRIAAVRLTPAGLVHRNLSPEELQRHISIKFDAEFINYVRGRDNLFDLPLRGEMAYYGLDLGALLTTLDAYCGGALTDAGHLRFAVGHFLAALADYLEKGDFPALRKPISRICSYIHENYFRGDLTIAEVAASVALSPNYIQQIFRQACGCTPKEYLNTYRLNMARRLLRRHEYRVKEVAMLCGWNCAHYFCNCYRRHFGLSPSEE